MTITVFPLDAVSGAPAYTGQMMRQAISALCGYAPSGRPLGTNSGVRPGTPTNTVTSTSSTWTVRPHSGVLDVETPAAAGVYLYAIDANVTGAVTAPDASNQRVDSLFIQLSDPAESDGSSTPGGAVVYTAGSPGAAGGSRGSAGGPPNIPSRAIEIAQINVPVSGGGSPSVSWVAATFGPVRWQGRQLSPSNTTNNAYTTVAMDTLDVNTMNTAVGGGSFRAPVDGPYLANGTVKFAANATGDRGGQFALNGAGVGGAQARVPAASGNTYVTLPPTIIQCSAGDVISMQGLQSSGGTLATVGGSMLTIVGL